MPQKPITISTGMRFGYWTVIDKPALQKINSDKRNYKYVRCQCDCGTVKNIRLLGLVRLDTRSCGCRRAELMSVANTVHGHARHGSQTHEYRCWQSAKMRCFSKNTAAYPKYGARGITMCDRWANSYQHFLEDMGPSPTPEHSLDRFPNQKGNYEPGNCRWATKAEQVENSSSAKIILVDGVARPIAQHAKHYGAVYGTVCHRLANGHSPEAALGLIPLRNPTAKKQKKRPSKSSSIPFDISTLDDIHGVVGTRFGSLTVTRVVAPSLASGQKRTQYELLCDCGLYVLRLRDSLKPGTMSTCGCYIQHPNKTHGHSSNGKLSHEYRAWIAMKTRCRNLKSSCSAYHGQIGVTMHEPWMDFSVFFDDVGRSPSPNHSLDRFPNGSGNYEPGNVRWATDYEQAENRRSSIMKTVEGVTRCVAAHARHYGIPENKVYWRLRRGHTIECALEVFGPTRNHKGGIGCPTSCVADQQRKL